LHLKEKSLRQKKKINAQTPLNFRKHLNLNELSTQANRPIIKFCTNPKKYPKKFDKVVESGIISQLE
jgi:hypothetical protein